ncbi:hypothetical protein scyTo_0004194 [Scyliorhinus torazame]|uniref:Uncharacterized protein n=1 Tax=Scyliorhinus torazame TaxID=75743 RepID=A0A401NMG3_SCYTO|nr:hypothetical protein [Scyliorhinus torazame]
MRSQHLELSLVPIFMLSAQQAGGGWSDNSRWEDQSILVTNTWSLIGDYLFWCPYLSLFVLGIKMMSNHWKRAVGSLPCTIPKSEFHSLKVPENFERLDMHPSKNMVGRNKRQQADPEALESVVEGAMATGPEPILPVYGTIYFLNTRFEKQRMETSEDLVRVIDPTKAAVERVEQQLESQGTLLQTMEESVSDHNDRLAVMEAELSLIASSFNKV